MTAFYASKDILLESINDQSPSVAKEALRLICKYKISIDLSDLNNLSLVDTRDHMRFICIALSRRLNKWDRLIFILKTLGLDKEDSALVNVELVDWHIRFNCSLALPSTLQLEKIKELYLEKKELMSDSQKTIVSFTLSTNN